MAKRTITKLYSDLSGKEIKDGVGGTVSFGLEGTTYKIDLTVDEQAKLRDALRNYIDVARPVPVASRPNLSGAPSSREIRAWAQENGHDVSARERIPALVVEAFNAARRTPRR